MDVCFLLIVTLAAPLASSRTEAQTPITNRPSSTTELPHPDTTNTTTLPPTTTINTLTTHLSNATGQTTTTTTSDLTNTTVYPLTTTSDITTSAYPPSQPTESTTVNTFPESTTLHLEGTNLTTLHGDTTPQDSTDSTVTTESTTLHLEGTNLTTLHGGSITTVGTPSTTGPTDYPNTTHEITTVGTPSTTGPTDYPNTTTTTITTPMAPTNATTIGTTTGPTDSSDTTYEITTASTPAPSPTEPTDYPNTTHEITTVGTPSPTGPTDYPNTTTTTITTPMAPTNATTISTTTGPTDSSDTTHEITITSTPAPPSTGPTDYPDTTHEITTVGTPSPTGPTDYPNTTTTTITTPMAPTNATAITTTIGPPDSSDTTHEITITSTPAPPSTGPTDSSDTTHEITITSTPAPPSTGPTDYPDTTHEITTVGTQSPTGPTDYPNTTTTTITTPMAPTNATTISTTTGPTDSSDTTYEITTASTPAPPSTGPTDYPNTTHESITTVGTPPSAEPTDYPSTTTTITTPMAPTNATTITTTIGPTDSSDTTHEITTASTPAPPSTGPTDSSDTTHEITTASTPAPPSTGPTDYPDTTHEITTVGTPSPTGPTDYPNTTTTTITTPMAPTNATTITTTIGPPDSSDTTHEITITSTPAPPSTGPTDYPDTTHEITTVGTPYPTGPTDYPNTTTTTITTPMAPTNATTITTTTGPTDSSDTTHEITTVGTPPSTEPTDSSDTTHEITITSTPAPPSTGPTDYPTTTTTITTMTPTTPPSTTPLVCSNGGVPQNGVCTCPDEWIGETCTVQNFCRKQVMNGFQFPQTPIGWFAYSQEICSLGTSGAGKPQASTRCSVQSGSPIFDSLQIFQCDQTLSDLQQNLTSPADLETLAASTQILTSKPEEMTAKDVTTATRIVNKLLLSPNATESVRVAAVATVSQLLNTSLPDDTEEINTNTGLTLTLDQLAVNLSVTLNSSESAVVQPNLVVQSAQIPAANTQGVQFTSLTGTSGRFVANRIQMNTNTSTVVMENRFMADALILVRFPPEAVSTHQIPTNVSLGFVLYQNDHFFRTRSHRRRRTSIRVLSASVKGQERSVVPQHVEMLFRPTIMNGTSLHDFACVFWDYDLEDWSTDGCSKGDASDGVLQCFCNHTTNFAALWTFKENYEYAEALGVISIVGLSFSILGLVVTIIHHIRYFRKSNSKNLEIALICITFSLLLFILTFLSGVQNQNNQIKPEQEKTTNHIPDSDEYVEPDRGSCSTVAALLHYFLLATFTWNSIYSTQLVLVTVGRSLPSHCMSVSVAAGWGIPAVLMAITLGATYSTRDPLGYRQEEFCWLAALDKNKRFDFGKPMFWGFLLPVGLILIYNMVLLVLILRTMSNTNPTSSINSSFKKNFLPSLSLVLLLGLSWTLGYLVLTTTGDVHLIISIVFCIFTTTQGFQIFYLFTVRTPTFRKVVTRSVEYLSSDIQLYDRSSYTLTWYREESSRSFFYSSQDTGQDETLQ